MTSQESLEQLLERKRKLQERIDRAHKRIEAMDDEMMEIDKQIYERQIRDKQRAGGV